MTKPAAEVMHEILVAAVIDGVTALRAASKGLPNALLRDINAIHPNTTFDDLPDDLRTSIQQSVRAGFTRLQKEGYTVFNPKLAPPPRPAPRPPAAPSRGPGAPRDQQRRPRPPGGGPKRPPRG